MQIFTKDYVDDYAFEMSAEVKDKMDAAKNLHTLISEEQVQDLQRIDVSGRIYCKAKRLFDIVLSAVGLLVLLVPLSLVALAVYLDDPGDIFFSQYRVGLNGKRFKLYKFRTMKMDTPKYLSSMELEDPHKYLTHIGHFLRKLSLDEFPQLINVLKGDMSLVGPRPLISDEYEIHAMRMRFGIYNIRPGVTGFAQINGRDAVAPAEKVRWDVLYLEQFGIWTDLKILLLTIPKIFSADGVVEGRQNATTESELSHENTE